MVEVPIWPSHSQLAGKCHMQSSLPLSLLFLCCLFLLDLLLDINICIPAQQHPSILAWRILWTEGPGGLQSMGLQTARHDWSDWAQHSTATGGCQGFEMQQEQMNSESMVFPVVMYGCESWTINKAKSQRIDAFELWCWRRLLIPLDSKEIKQDNP